MNAIKSVLTITLFVIPILANSATAQDKFRNGIIGTGFITNSGSSTYNYTVLIDYRIHGRHLVELKFVERSGDDFDQPELSENEHAELVMVNCTQRMYTTGAWTDKKENDNNYGYKEYKNGIAISWDDKSENAYHSNYSGDLASYFKMVCDSL